MKNFIKKAVKRLPKLDSNQIADLISLIADEYELLEIVLDSMTEGVMVADKNDNLIFLNTPVKRMMRLANLNENVEQKIWKVIKDPHVNDFLRKYFAGEEENKTASIVVNYSDTVFPGGSSFASEASSPAIKLLEITIMPLVKNNVTIGNVIIVRDITDKKFKESKLRRAESLASLTTLAAGVAHEIKNPLGSISIYLQMIEKTINKNSSNKVSKEIKESVSIIKEEVERLNKVVIDFLFAVKPVNMIFIDEDLNNFITETVELLLPELKNAEIKVETDFSPKLPRVAIDKRYIKQTLINLIQNAEFAMRAIGGVIKIATEYKDNQAIIKVTDTGTGIPDHILPRIFEPYFTTKDFGSGIGLTISYKIIKEHGGDISVITKENKGTTFIITLPIPEKGQKLLAWQNKGDAHEIFDINS
ncbi:MAG: ATP-binding protein [Spirochaetes bacterium]|nr:ATP-binding protein [Spirochaetota bacterium]